MHSWCAGHSVWGVTRFPGPKLMPLNRKTDSTGRLHPNTVHLAGSYFTYNHGQDTVHAGERSNAVL